MLHFNPGIPLAHAGDLGDIIYALPAIRALGGGRLSLFKCPRGSTAHPLTRERASLIEPLLLEQSYVENVNYSESPVSSPLNNFRQPGNWCGTIADSHLAAIGKPSREWDSAWLRADRIIKDYPIIFHRSSRYQNKAFPWDRVLEKYGRHAVFVGLPKEHEEFRREWGFVPYVPTVNLLELARIISGCRLFVGNQSSPFAIAEGMKATAILEVCTEYNNCSYPRENVVHGHDENVHFPEL